MQTRAKYNYFDAEPELHEKVVALEAVCAKHSVPLAAAALRFPLMHPAVTSVVCGVVRTLHDMSVLVTNVDCTLRYAYILGPADGVAAAPTCRRACPRPRPTSSWQRWRFRWTCGAASRKRGCCRRGCRWSIRTARSERRCDGGFGRSLHADCNCIRTTVPPRHHPSGV